MRRMYSENQVRKLIETGDLNVEGEINASGDIKGKLIELDLTSLLNTNLFGEGSSLYSKFIVESRRLWIIISGQFVNGSSSSANETAIANKEITLPSEIASKIYRADGTNLAENPSSSADINVSIASGVGTRQTSNLASLPIVLKSLSANHISLILFGMGTHTEGNSYWLDIRIPLLII